jgi:VanZ family protein
MNILLSVLPIVYIAGIFLPADSPMVSATASFNPYSLLHIPLYGILAFLLLLFIAPYKRGIINPINSINQIEYMIGGLIACGVAIADEIHQVYLPPYNASMIDFFCESLRRYYAYQQCYAFREICKAVL